jgi:predicted SAM-dependent methyltransferase
MKIDSSSLEGRVRPFRSNRTARAADESSGLSRPEGAALKNPSIRGSSGATRRRVLHVGSGAASDGRLHAIFRSDQWAEVRLDVDVATDPDLVCSVTDMSAAVGNATFDGIWSSHNLEHVRGHEVLPALREFVRVLRPDGFALIRSPDLESIAELILRDGIDSVVYQSPAGPITPLDMLYGHQRSIEQGNEFMRHGTGFTQDRLGRLLIEAGFEEARTTRTPQLEVWAVAFMPAADVGGIVGVLARSGLDFSLHEEARKAS